MLLLVSLGHLSIFLRLIKCHLPFIWIFCFCLFLFPFASLFRFWFGFWFGFWVRIFGSDFWFGFSVWIFGLDFLFGFSVQIFRFGLFRDRFSIFNSDFRFFLYTLSAVRTPILKNLPIIEYAYTSLL